MNVEFAGFLDLQVNGFGGIDFNTPGSSPEEIARASAAMQATGVTRYLPTFITSSFDRFRLCVRAFANCRDEAVAGFHMEGPYISPLDGARGAHPRAHVMAACREDFLRRQEAAGGRIVLVTLAPEVPGALALIEFLVEQNVRVAIGHTAADAAQIHDAVRAGATLSTHLGNGCAQQLHRHANPLWPQLANDGLMASVIADGHHVPADPLRAFVRAKHASRIVLVTDAMSAAAARPGRYWLGELEVDLQPGGRVAMPGTPQLAGSALTMPEAVGHLVRVTGLDLAEVLPMAGARPAEWLGVALRGRVSADWNPLTCELKVTHVVC